MFSHSVMSDSLQPHVLQHTRPPCPSPSPRACSNSCPLTRVMPSNHRILCHPLLILPSIFLSIRVFSNEVVLCMRWPKYWSFSISPSSAYSGLSSFRNDWFDLLVVQGIFKSLLQHHSSKTLILQHSAFFTVQLSYPYMTTGKIIALTRQTFVCKVMSVPLEGLIASHTRALPRIYCLNPYFPPLDGPCILKCWFYVLCEVPPHPFTFQLS